MEARVRNLKSVHYALALANRIQARIYIIRQKPTDNVEISYFNLMNQTLYELIDKARQSGVSLSLYEGCNNFVDEIVDLVKSEHITLLVFNAETQEAREIMKKIKLLISAQIIQIQN